MELRSGKSIVVKVKNELGIKEEIDDEIHREYEGLPEVQLARQMLTPPWQSLSSHWQIACW